MGYPQNQTHRHGAARAPLAPRKRTTVAVECSGGSALCDHTRLHCPREIAMAMAGALIGLPVPCPQQAPAPQPRGAKVQELVL